MKVNLDNYEAFLIDRVEGALSPSDEAELDAFLMLHPAIKEELALYEATLLEPDTTIVYRDKDALNKKDGVVIPLFAASKWLIAAAAVTVIFVGVRFMNNTAPEQSGAAYQPATVENTVPQKDTEMQDENADHSFHLANTAPQQQMAPVREDVAPQAVRPLLTAQGIPVKDIEALPARQLTPRLKAMDMDAMYAYNKGYNYENMMKDVYEPADNNTIVDKWNDALATVNDMSSVLGLNKKQSTDAAASARVKTTSIRILGFEYYNRKRINN